MNIRWLFKRRPTAAKPGFYKATIAEATVQDGQLNITLDEVVLTNHNLCAHLILVTYHDEDITCSLSLNHAGDHVGYYAGITLTEPKENS